MENALLVGIPVEPPHPVPIGADGKPIKLSEEEIEARRAKSSLSDCLEHYFKPQYVEFRCSSCGRMSTRMDTQALITFPDVLVVNARREYFDPYSCTVRKLDVFLDAPEQLNIETYRAQVGESVQVEGQPRVAPESPNTVTSKNPSTEVNEEAMAMLLSMGIDLVSAKWALLHCNNDVERAIDFVFNHPEGPPSEEGRTPQEHLTPLTNGAARYELTAMISHIGSSAVTGHYVCHVKDSSTRSWVLFNDEKVAKSNQPPFPFASSYFYTRSA